MKPAHVYGLIGGIAVLGYAAYVATPKHPMRIQ
jgi:hypothetical protein